MFLLNSEFAGLRERPSFSNLDDVPVQVSHSNDIYRTPYDAPQNDGPSGEKGISSCSQWSGSPPLQNMMPRVVRFPSALSSDEV
jgi:hypothetical protein